MDTATTQPLDIKTLLLLVVEHELPRERIFSLIAREVNIPVDRLMDALTVHPQAPARTRQPRARWTDARLNELAIRWNSGDRPSKIAEVMGCTTATVYHQIADLRKTRTDIQKRKTPATSGF